MNDYLPGTKLERLNAVKRLKNMTPVKKEVKIDGPRILS